jgi:hypothetical protein
MYTFHLPMRVAAALAPALLAAAAAAQASDPWVPVASSVLAEVRGGFTSPSGLELSLGIERLATINGAVVAQASVRVDDLRNIGAAQAAQAGAALGATLLVQDNLASLGGAVGLPPGTFIQNSLNGQSIANLTTINASVNSASILKSMNFDASVRDAGIAALRTH